MILPDKALVWWESIQDEEMDLDVWENVKAQVLKTYEPEY
jgi:hypothetical protein